ncbi:hypothetical protein [Streptomyces chilikensis]|uniref:hypothetical protein n=1 Tax=Streptomyces chilikensis TaxID=1194079 RepID=UPI00140A4E0C|nr:hypothetical protein [Streptomyces chilikensis]
MTTKEKTLRLSRRIGVAAAVAAAAFATLSPASASTATAAEAAACGVTPTNRDTSAYGQYFTQDVYLRSGPEWGCQILHTASVTNKVDYWCTADGFTYLRTASTKYGWVSNLYLVKGGSHIPC